MRRLRRGRPSERRLHLVDVENLAGTGHLTRGIVSACSTAYADLGLLGEGDHVIVACNPLSQVEVGLGWRGPRRIVVGHGPDGADRALLRVMEEERIDRRFSEIVLASGDGIFAESAAELEGRGVPVMLVSRVESLSARLRAAIRARPVRFPEVPAAHWTTATDLRLAA